MGAPSHDRIGLVRALIEKAPDSAIAQLNAAFKSEDAGKGLAAVQALIEAEVLDRTIRDEVFSPVLALCAPREDGFEQIEFPRVAVTRLWRVLKQTHPHLVAAALAKPETPPEDEPFPPAYDQLCREAAKGLRQPGGDYAPPAQALEVYRAGASSQFADYLVLAPFARDAAARLPAWTRSMTSETAAGVRLMFKDAAAVAPDANPRLMEMLQAQLREPWQVLRVVAVAIGRASDRFVADSEMAGFGERILADIDRRLALVRAFDVEGGPDAGAKAARHVCLAAAAAAEFETALEVDKQAAWGQRLGKQKILLASLTEGHLKKCGKLVGEALPTLPVRPGVVRGDPRLDAEPDARLLKRAMGALTFFDRVRGAAAVGGFGTVRTKVGEEVAYSLNGYLEDLLAIVHAGDEATLPAARAYLETGAEFLGLIQDEKAAQIVRRRAAAA